MSRAFHTTLLATAAFALGVSAQTPPAGFVVETVADLDLTHPTDVAFLPGRRVVVAKKAGSISLYGGATLTALANKLRDARALALDGAGNAGDPGDAVAAGDPGDAVAASRHSRHRRWPRHASLRGVHDG